MNRTFASLSAIALVVPVPIVAPTPAAAQGYRPAVDFCKGDVPNNPPFVLGDCMGFVTNFNNGSEGLVRFVCDYLSITDPDLFYDAYGDVPECIRDRASDLPPPPYN
jgi:hypothetical protein